MSLLIPDELVKASGLSESEILLELIVLLFQQEKITLAKASRLIGMTRIQFQQLLASPKIPVHYEIQDLHEDIANLKEVSSTVPFMLLRPRMRLKVLQGKVFALSSRIFFLFQIKALPCKPFGAFKSCFT